MVAGADGAGEETVSDEGGARMREQPVIVVDSIENAGSPDRRRDGMHALASGEHEAHLVTEHEGLQALLSRRPFKLNLWAQTVPREGYVNVGSTTADREIVDACDVICDIRDLGWIPDGTADEILAVNAIQRFYRTDTIPVFVEWRRVLKPGGKLIVEAPDVRELAKAIGAASDMDIYDAAPPLIWGIDGSQLEGDELIYVNRNGMTASRCRLLLELAKFVDIKSVEPQSPPCFRPFALEAHRPMVEVAGEGQFKP